jgi:(2R)-3-sulfolactate dehydrogenase (NADP+)
MFANTPSAMAPWGGRRALFGTNPIAFAAPREGNTPPLVIDLALTEVARGRILAAAQEGGSIPAGWALDRNGQPTTDARAALEGTLLPAGGAKGAALALMVELLAATLTGAHFASEASSFLDAKGPPPGTGQLIVAIDPGAVAAGSSPAARIDLLCRLIEAEPGARTPGSRRHALRARAARDGVRVDGRLMAEVRGLAGG